METNASKRSRYLKYVLFLGLPILVIFIGIIAPELNERDRRLKEQEVCTEEVYQNEYIGIVESIFLSPGFCDFRLQGIGHLIVSPYENSSYSDILETHLQSTAEIGDSLIKYANSDTIIVKKKNNKTFKYKVKIIGR